MTKYTLSILTSLALLVSCANSKEVNEKSDDISAEEVGETHAHDNNESQSNFENISSDDSLFASIKRGFCFGTCPVYELKIYNSGFIVYNGTANVKMKGVHTTKITKDQMLTFVEKANAIGFMQMENEYDDPGVTDLPEMTTSIVINGERKTVRRRVGFPREILAFEKMFDALLESEDWGVTLEER